MIITRFDGWWLQTLSYGINTDWLTEPLIPDCRDWSHTLYVYWTTYLHSVNIYHFGITLFFVRSHWRSFSSPLRIIMFDQTYHISNLNDSTHTFVKILCLSLYEPFLLWKILRKMYGGLKDVFLQLNQRCHKSGMFLLCNNRLTPPQRGLPLHTKTLTHTRTTDSRWMTLLRINQCTTFKNHRNYGQRGPDEELIFNGSLHCCSVFSSLWYPFYLSVPFVVDCLCHFI